MKNTTIYRVRRKNLHTFISMEYANFAWRTWYKNIIFQKFQNVPSASNVNPRFSFSSSGINCHSAERSDQAPFHSVSLPQGLRIRINGISPEALGVSI